MAADTALEYMKTRVGGLGGVIVVSSSGEWAARFSTKQMSWATVKDDKLHYGIYTGERHTKSLDEALASESEGFWDWRTIDYGQMKISILFWRTLTIDLIFLERSVLYWLIHRHCYALTQNEIRHHDHGYMYSAYWCLRTLSSSRRMYSLRAVGLCVCIL